MISSHNAPGLSLTLVYSSTNMSKLVWTSGIWKPLVHKNMSNFWNNIFRRFDDTSVVKATAIADFKMWPTSEEELQTFGDDWMNTLLDQFGSYLDDKDDQIKAEWPMLKTAVLEVFLVSSDTTWLQINRRFRNEYPHVLNFFDLILTIPATSAACEWGFTHMKLVKSQQRSSLKEDIVSDCLMIKLEGDSIKDLNPDASIQYRFDVIARRPGGSQTMENIKHATVIEASTSQEVEDEVEMVQEMDAVEDIEYDLVEDAEEDSDYKSDFDSEEEDSNDI